MARKASRSKAATVDWLAKAVTQATRSAQFCVTGCLTGVDPGLVVQDLGDCRFPLKRTVAKELVARCHVAPYGKGTETLIDPRVRNALELDPEQFQLSDTWNAAIAAVTQQAAGRLGLPAGQLEARLYKLLVYEKGGFFLPHRDSEKHERMVASLIVVLPNPFEGGALVVRHGSAKQTLTFVEAARGETPCYAAFYADCEHEVQRVTRGVRVCLAYNLVLKSAPRPAGEAAGPINPVARSIRQWVANQPGAPLVFALEHYYTQRGLSVELLKGADRQLADVVAAAAEQADCVVQLAQVSRHLLQFADDGSFERSFRSWRYDTQPRQFQIGETYEDELKGSDWTDLDGRKQPWGALPLEPSAIVASVPLDEWQPTSEDFEGYTGNAGNTLDRWYHRSALVVWDRAHHYDVLASAGPANSMPLFTALVAKLARMPAKKRETARADGIQFARAMIDSWPVRRYFHANRRNVERSVLDDFPEALRALHDQDTVARYLAMLAERDRAQPLRSFVVAVCREFGWGTFAPQLRQLLTARPENASPHVRQDIPPRDLDWLAAYCCDRAADADQLALAWELCGLAVERFCEPLPQFHRAPYEGAEPTVAEQSLPPLLKALASTGHDDDLTRVIRFVAAAPDAFRIEECQVPALKAVVPWAQEHLDTVPAPLTAWLAAVRAQLAAATAQEPRPPSDWARPCEVTCSCPYCTQLRTFLTDPTAEVGRIRAAEYDRNHVLHTIHQHRCDVKDSLERRGSPYTLVLTKTQASYERAVRRFARDRELLSELPSRCS